MMIRYDYIMDGHIYSLNSNTWRNMTGSILYVDYRFNDSSSIFVNGGLHWVVNIMKTNNSSNFVLVFNLKEETFGHIPCPGL